MKVYQHRAVVEFALLLTLLARASTGAELPDPGQPTTVGAPVGANDYIEYQLRPGEDPGKVARMFHVTLAELLALNHISDPRRVGTGAPLRIPDPRASMLAQLRSQKDALEQQLATAQARISAQEKASGDLESQVARLRAANRALQRDELFYKVWQAAVLVCATVALLFGFALVALRTRMRAQDKRLALANKQIEVLRVASDKYRKLGAHFELRCQNLFHQIAVPGGGVLPKAQDLRQTYEDDCAQLDAIVAEAEREISGALTSTTSDATPQRVKTPLLRLHTARRGGG